MKIPFVDLQAQYKTIKKEIDYAIQNVIAESAFVKGKYVEEFEEKFAIEYGVNHCIGVANGTDAIYLVLKMAGLGPGDEVITVANSWISTSETISQVGAKPIFIDVDDYYTIDTKLIEDSINSKTKAVIAVHLYGQPANIEIISNICKKHNLLLIEDCAQSHFAEFQNKRVGTFGIAATFSFYPGKNLGAYGDAGAVITNDAELAKSIRMYANHGALKKHQHEIEGVNSRLDGLQAAILSAKLPYIHEWNKARLNNALYYNHLLSDINEIHLPKIRNNAQHIFHLYVIRAEKREALMAYLNSKNIETAIHYPIALPLMNAYKYLGYKYSDFPIAYRNQKQIVSLPMYAELSRNAIEYVSEIIHEFYKYI